MAGHLLALGRLEARQSRPEPAAGHLAEAMGLYAETGDRRMLVDCLVTAAACAASRPPEAALTLFGAATALAGALQLRPGEACALPFSAGRDRPRPAGYLPTYRPITPSDREVLEERAPSRLAW